MHIYGGYVDLKGSNSELWTFDFGEYISIAVLLVVQKIHLYEYFNMYLCD